MPPPFFLGAKEGGGLFFVERRQALGDFARDDFARGDFADASELSSAAPYIRKHIQPRGRNNFARKGQSRAGEVVAGEVRRAKSAQAKSSAGALMRQVFRKHTCVDQTYEPLA